jgi:hypothetical protein
MLRQPFPRESSFRRSVVGAVISGLIVAVFLRVFSPFGFSNAGIENLNLFAAGYGLITFSVVILFGLIEMLMPSVFDERKWTVGKNILLYIILVFVIGTCNLFYTSITTGMNITANSFFDFQLFTLAVTFVVVSFMTMIRYFKSLGFYTKNAKVIDDKVHLLKPVTNESLIIISSENEKENLQMLIQDLLFIESADNYSKIVYKKEKKIISTLIRSSLKRLEQQFSQHEIFRCHRSFIVQLRNVERISGNSQGFRLHFKDVDEAVPVSRSAGQIIHDKIMTLNAEHTEFVAHRNS